MTALEQLEEAYVLVKKMLNEGTMPKETYLKYVISLASDYASLGKMEDAMSMVSQGDNSYFDNIMPDQMRSDSMFYQAVIILSSLVKDYNPEILKAETEDDIIERVLTHSVKGQA